MKKFRDLVEAKDTIVFAFGRFNPPTTGHEKLIQKTAKVAGSNPYRVFPSHTQNPKKDPLPQALKTAYMRKMFKKYARNIVVSKSRNAIEIAVELYNQGYKNLVMIAGSDRVKVFDSMLNQYNGVEGKAHGYYKFDSIEVVSAGERDPDAEGVAGMSASKMRAAAADGDYDSFVTGIPTTLPDGDKKKLYRDVRKYMGIREERDMGDMSDFEAVRDAYLTGKIWNVGTIVEVNGLSGEVVRKGTNYLSFMTEDGKVHKAWLHEIEESAANMPKALSKLSQVISTKKRAISTAKKDFKTTVSTNRKDMDSSVSNVAGKPSRAVGVKWDGAATSQKAFNKAKKEKDKAVALANIPKQEPTRRSEEVEFDEAKSPLQRLKDFDKSRVAAGKKPIFTDKKPPKFVRMKKSGQMTIMNVPTDEIGKFEKKGYKIIEEVELDERNYRKEYDNYQGRPEQIARRSSRNKARRVMGDKTKIGMDVGHKDNDPMNNDPTNLRNEDPSENRREPRLRKKPAKIKGKVYKPGDKPPPGGWPKMTFGTKRMPKKEEVELDEIWYDTVVAKVDQMTHPKGYEKMVMDYAKLMRQDKYKKHPNVAAGEVARSTKRVNTREFMKYINRLVAKKVLPQNLKAEYQTEDLSFKNFVDQLQEGAYGYERQDSDIKDKEGTQPAKYHKGLSKSTKQKRDAHFKAKKSGPAPGDADAETKPSVHTKKFKQMYGEALPKDADMGDYIDDFQKSDSPQFKGKSEKKRKEMAIAAFLSKNEQDGPCWDGYKQVGMKKKNGKEVPNCVPEEVELDEKVEGLVNKAEKSGISYSILKKVYDRGLAAYKTGHRPGTTAPQWAFARVNSFITGGGARKSDNDLWKQHKEEFNEWGELEEASEYQGKKVTLNKPFYTPDGPKKSAVYVNGPKDKVVIVRFGDPNMEIKKDDPERRKSFRARHNCDNPGPKWKARYWSCKAW